jgi:hypothetical protein
MIIWTLSSTASNGSNLYRAPAEAAGEALVVAVAAEVAALLVQQQLVQVS